MNLLDLVRFFGNRVITVRKYESEIPVARWVYVDPVKFAIEVGIAVISVDHRCAPIGYLLLV
jgi:hypothetical protein